MKGVLHRIEADLAEGWMNELIQEAMAYLRAHEDFRRWCELRGQD
jgi:hypothetical protein